MLGAAAELLGQCEAIVGAVGDGQFVAGSAVLAGGTIGKHLRHTLDHYGAIVSRGRGEPIDYDHRERGVPVESSRVAARDQITSLRAALSALEGTGGDEVRIRVMVSGDGREAVLRSTVAREVAFATHHGVHHVAMMRAIALEHGIELGADVGKAPSTINFERAGA
ncbi:MAG: hypothetical protein IT431_13005 [Phycisphaerales bacterium]|nr:hypothetical protein [Phycisphaerales bacterium]